MLDGLVATGDRSGESVIVVLTGTAGWARRPSPCRPGPPPFPRIKTIKRQMYGRANLDLLRKRVLATS